MSDDMRQLANAIADALDAVIAIKYGAWDGGVYQHRDDVEAAKEMIAIVRRLASPNEEFRS